MMQSSMRKLRSTMFMQGKVHSRLSASMAPPSREKLDSRVWPISVSTLMMGTAMGIIIPILPSLATQLGLSVSEFGLVVSAVGFSRLLMNFPLAIVADFVGRRPLLIYGPVCNVFVMIGHALTTTLYELGLCRMLGGVSSSAQITGAHLYLADISTPLNRARTLAPLSIAWNVGFSIGPAIGGFMADLYGFQLPFYFVAVGISFIALTNYYYLPETLVKNPDLESLKVNYLEEFKRRVLLAMLQWKMLANDLNIKLAVLLHTTFWIVCAGTHLTLFPILVVQSFGLTLSQVGSLFAVYSITNALVSQPSAMWSDRMGRKMAIIPGGLVLALTVGLLPWCVSSYTGLLFISFSWGLGASLMGTAPTVYVTDLTTPATRSQALAFLRTGGDSGIFLGASLTGVLASLIGIEWAISVNGVLMGLVTAAFACFASESVAHGKLYRQNPPSTTSLPTSAPVNGPSDVPNSSRE